MINRVLIRIKVVQLLYSYLLVENRFNLESAPLQPTREKRFAYGLYLEMLGLMASVASEIKQRGGHRPLYETRFISRIINDEKIRSLFQKHISGGSPFGAIESALTEKVKTSGLYKKFLKSENPGSLADEKIWQDIFNLIIMPDPEVNNVISSMEGFTLGGVDRMREIMAATFSNFFASADNLKDALNSLRLSLEKARELYIRLLQLPILLTDLRDMDIEANRKKFLATPQDRNPNLRFVENAFVAVLRDSEELENGIKTYGRQMTADDGPLLRSLLNAIMASDIYKEYMEFPATDFRRDCEVWRDLYRNVIFENPDFLEALEDKSVFWNDDLGIIGDFVLKTVKRVADSAPAPGEEVAPTPAQRFLLPMFKDEEDSRFGRELFGYVMANKETYRQYIDDALDKNSWESDRLAYMDTVVIMTALAEILNFPKIPVKVSINEYIEIAKSYSTAKSGQFINGILGDIFRRLREEGKLMK